jgi:hypothetical protein
MSLSIFKNALHYDCSLYPQSLILRAEEPAHPWQVEMPIWCHVYCKQRDQICTENAIQGSKKSLT